MRQPFSTEPTFEERMGAAYEAGRQARIDGLPISRCPFTPGTPADVEWRTGWHEACAARGIDDFGARRHAA
jgi:ribosome modulation factor